MKALVLGDIHGNLIALENVLSKFKDEVDLVICHGDVVNYGPWSNECVELLEEVSCITLKGNHECAYINGFYPGKNPLVRDFFNHTFPRFKHLDVIKRYEEKVRINTFEIKHTIENRYIYPDTDLSGLELDFNTIIGHSHYAFKKVLSNGKLLINTGSVGQNRVDLAIINFVIADFAKEVVEIKSVSYNPMPLIKEMKLRNYPKTCIEYYLGKIKN